ncbi:hypothetical protein [Caballeronia sp. AZ7_KS35]|uniref:hypothetical protein n=1 Tax=Caballeronia sp. AZ7_KS35 TaxID=2921762 RepID=UPI0020290C17|nr:hypothetical protein [Caballeronia sp. AZ7_KS35]
MTASLQIKITINEFVTPDLFRAVSAIPNPRQRASLLKRLAEDALRNSVPTSQIAPTATSVTAGTSVMPRAIRSEAEPSSSSIEPGPLFSETGVFDEDQRQFGCTSDVSSAARAPQTLQPIEGSPHNLVTGTPSQRDTVATLASLVPDSETSAPNPEKEPTRPVQPVKYGETPYADTITRSSRRRGFLTRALVTAALAMEKSGYRLRLSIIGRERRAKKMIGN